MTRYFLIRLAGMIPILLIISMITFGLMHGVPGGPWEPGQRPLSENQIAALKEKYGLDKPLAEQYLTWLKGAATGDLGMTFEHPDESVTDIIRRTWPVTMHLGAMALLLAFGVGLPLGIIAALKPNTWVDYLATLVSIVGFVTPSFVWAIFFILLFAITLDWLPMGGWGGPKYWIMPVAAYALAPIAVIARYTRASVMEAMNADYVRTARAKGLRERRVVTIHVLKNAMIPMITALAPIVPDLITGSIFIEAIFRIPGMGQFWVTSIFKRDYPVIISLVLLWAVLISLTYLITDILYVAVDPRVSYN
jgi:ABC-type dipeptide/oligopeptide/nickel transport system permease component